MDDERLGACLAEGTRIVSSFWGDPVRSIDREHHVGGHGVATGCPGWGAQPRPASGWTMALTYPSPKASKLADTCAGKYRQWLWSPPWSIWSAQFRWLPRAALLTHGQPRQPSPQVQRVSGWEPLRRSA